MGKKEGNCLKERVVLFSDAIIAIILTIMVLELPIEYLHNGTVELSSLFRSIGIYFISFCFVANVWFQTAYVFKKIDEVKNKTLVSYMLLLFVLSLVPTVTRILIEHTNKQTILLYGVLTFIVMLVMNRVIVSVTKQTDQDSEVLKFTVDELNKQELFSIILRTLLIIFSYFFVHTALVIYLFLPIIEFLQNIVDREEEKLVGSLDTVSQQDYVRNRNQLWGNTRNRYTSLLRDSLQDNANSHSLQQERWIEEWQMRIAQEIKNKENELSKNQAGKTSKVENQLEQLYRQRDRLNKRQQRLNRNSDKHSFNK